MEAAINPREWITVPAAINVVNQLHETTNSNLLQNIDWIIIPVVNPDGYEYTHTNVSITNLGFNVFGTQKYQIKIWEHLRLPYLADISSHLRLPNDMPMPVPLRCFEISRHPRVSKLDMNMNCFFLIF